jgi:hypothetical protein
LSFDVMAAAELMTAGSRKVGIGLSTSESF